MNDFNTLHQWVSISVLAALLFVPVSRLIGAMSCRRLQKRSETPLSERERHGQLTRARFIAIPLVVAFSYLFYGNVIRGLYGG